MVNIYRHVCSNEAEGGVIPVLLENEKSSQFSFSWVEASFPSSPGTYFDDIFVVRDIFHLFFQLLVIVRYEDKTDIVYS
jgi:hypothetical protein